MRRGEQQRVPQGSQGGTGQGAAPAAVAAPPARQPVLPARRYGPRILEKVEENQVTLVIGDTGCGASRVHSPTVQYSTVQTVLF